MRDTYLDNIKGFLIILVIIGHVAVPYKEHIREAQFVYNFIYLFHMPLFILISGYLNNPEKPLKDTVYTLLLPYIIFQSFFVFEEYFFNYHGIKALLHKAVAYPGDGLWYLICLFLWRISYPYYVKVKRPLLTALAVGVIGGFIPVYLLYKCLSFFPFFVIGHYLKAHGVSIHSLATYKGYKLFITLVVCSAIIFAIFASDRFMQDLVVYDTNVYSLNGPVLFPMVTRTLAYFIEVIVGISIILLFIPKTNSILTRIGRRSLYVYLLQGIIVTTIAYVGYWHSMMSLKYFIVAAFMGIPLSLMLSSDIVVRVSKPFIEPKYFFSQFYKTA